MADLLLRRVCRLTLIGLKLSFNLETLLIQRLELRDGLVSATAGPFLGIPLVVVGAVVEKVLVGNLFGEVA